MTKLTRQQISEAIALEAPAVPFTMPFFLAAELLKECRRQGLRNLKFGKEDECVTVKIIVKRPRIPCPGCGKSVALCQSGYIHSHRNKAGQWCESTLTPCEPTLTRDEYELMYLPRHYRSHTPGKLP